MIEPSATELTSAESQPGEASPIPARFARFAEPAELAELARMDLFVLGQRAFAAAKSASGGRGVFTRSRQLLGTGAWRGPRDAALSFVDEEDLDALGGLEAAQAAGAHTVLARTVAGARAAARRELRIIGRLVYARSDAPEVRAETLRAARQLATEGLPLVGLLPTPVGEPMGLDSLRFFASLRLAVKVPLILADFASLGHRLAQMALGFGANELFGPILPERALRLGANAQNPVMTRKEAAVLLRGAGLAPAERLSGGTLEDVEP